MKFPDLIRLIFGNINRRKGRVALTAIGVIIGSAAMVILISLGEGITRSTKEQLTRSSSLTQIQVLPPTPAPGKNPGTANRLKLITNSTLTALGKIPDVDAVYPYQYLLTNLPLIKYNNLQANLSLIGIGAIEDLTKIGLVADKGTVKLEKGAIIIGVSVADGFAYPNPSQATEALPRLDLYDQTLKIILSKADSDGNTIYKTLFYRVSGVAKAQGDGVSDYWIYMQLDDIKAINEWTGGKLIDYDKDGYTQAVVKVNDVDKVLKVVDNINTNLGFKTNTPLQIIRGMNNNSVILQMGFGFIGAIVLLVAAIGIANTMTTAIQERTAEIGLMKAVGATNNTVLAIFLGEAACIGFFGGLGGAIIGWLAGQGLNEIALIYLAIKNAQESSPPPSVVVFTPLWLPGFTLLFSTFIGLLSGLLPALRAANMTPVEALKHE